MRCGYVKIISDYLIPVIFMRVLSIGAPKYFAALSIALWAVITIYSLHFTHEMLHYLNTYGDEYIARFSQTYFHKIKKVSITIATTTRSNRRKISTVVSSASMHHCLTHHGQFRLLFTIVNKAYYYISPHTGMLGAILIILTNHESRGMGQKGSLYRMEG